MDRPRTTNMSPSASFVLSLVCLLLVWPGECLAREEPCPEPCRCTERVVNCTGRNLYYVPELPLWTEVLLMGDNPLETLVAKDNRLLVTPDNLIRLDFSRTNLRSVRSDFLQQLFNDAEYLSTKLESLIFDHNFLTSFPLVEFAGNLKSLSVAGNQLSKESIAQLDISTYPALESLDLSDNAIEYIPRHFLAGETARVHTKLTSLSMRNSQINTIEPGAFDSLVNLRVLRLSRNNLASVSKEWLNRLNALKELDLNSNRIELIDTLAFNGSNSLETLKMRRNRLSHLPDGSFWGLAKLQKLNLDHNSLSDVRLGWTYGLISLTELTIRYNSINEIQSGAWNPTSKLAELYLNHNQLQRIERDTFSKLSSLKVLKLSNNSISLIDESAFHPLTSIDTLDLSDNQLSWTIESSNGFFSKSKSLKKLRLDNNKIHLILKHTLSGLSELSLLSLSGNPISSIQSGSFSWFNNLSELNLEDTDLLCDCTMKWLVEWLQVSQIRRKFASKMHCKHPTQLYERTKNSLLDADIEEFQCQPLLKPYLIDDFQSSKPISAIKGKNMTFYCKVASSSADQVQFQWIKDGQKMDASQSRVKYETLATASTDNTTIYTNVFTLINVSDADQGNYQCMASNSYDSVFSHKFQVNVHVIPYFIKKPQNVTAKVGSTARLECAAKGQPTPVISWQKDAGDNFPAAAERRMRIYPSDDVYFIVDITKNDMGTYTCNATNEAGTMLSVAVLNVVEPPSFVRKMANKEEELGSTVELNCMAAGIPMPKITWYKDGQVLEPTKRHFFTAEGQILIIVKLKSSDQGEYSCNISNVYGSEEDTFFLKISSSKSMSALAPPADNSKSDDIFGSFVNFMRTHGVILLIIISCVVFTSTIWIVVICYIRRRDKQFPTDNNGVPDVENFTEMYDDDPDCDKSRNEQLRLTSVPYFHSLTEVDGQDYNSEDSEKDTGIEGSCKSTEDENEQLPYSYSPHHYSQTYLYQSLPRECHVQYPTTNITHMSLPRKQVHNQTPLIVEQPDRSGTRSAKEKRLMLKRLKDQHISSFKQQVVPSPYYTSAQLKTFSYRSYSVNDIQHL